MIGYACINETLKPKSFMTCRLNSVQNKGIDYLRDKALHNATFLKDILKWNLEHGIYMYRVISDIIPLATHPDIMNQFQWRWYKDKEILSILAESKDFATLHDLRLSMHPDQFTVINSNKPEIVETSISFLKYHAMLLDAIGGKDMILHVGGVYGDKIEAMKRFVSVYNALDESIKKYIRLENDDRSYTIFDVLAISKETGVPICFDYHHHRCLSDETVTSQLLDAIVATWNGNKPKMHISSGSLNEKDRKHHDYISEKDGIILHQFLQGHDMDIMVEAKRKEIAALRLIKQFEKIKT